MFPLCSSWYISVHVLQSVEKDQPATYLYRMDEKNIRSHDLLSRQSGTVKLKEGKHTSIRAHPLLASLRTTVVAKSCLALCDPMGCSIPGFLVLHYLLEFSQTHVHWSIPGSSDGEEFACNAGDLDLIPGSERSLGEEMATHSSILAWKIQWTEEHSRLQSTGSQRVRHNWSGLAHAHWVCDAIQPTHPLSSFSPPALNLSLHQGLFHWVGS